MSNSIIVEDEYFKSISKQVEGFNGLQLRLSPYGSISSANEHNENIIFQCDLDIDDNHFLSIIKWIENNAVKILDISLKSFEEQYWENRPYVIESLEDESQDYIDTIVPKITSYKEIIKLCGIHCIHIKESDDLTNPSFGIEFGCNWEDEHGAGIRFLGLNVIDVGSAIESFDF